MKVLITGATGFVGQAICRILSDAGLDLIRVAGPSYSAGQTLTENRGIRKSLRFDVAVDLTDPESAAALGKYKDISVIIHCAGLAHQFGETKKERFDSVNVKGTQNIAVQAVKMKIERLILISTVAVYGPEARFDEPAAGAYQESAICRPAGPYGASKLTGEQIAAAVCRENKINLTILRPSTVLGENDPGNLRRLMKAVDERKFLWLGDGRNKKSFIYKDDLGRVCLEIIRKSEQAYEVLNVTAEPVTVEMIMKLLEEKLRRRILRIPVSPQIVRKICRAVQNGDRRTVWESKSIIPGAGRIKRFFQTLEKWFAEEIYSGDKLKQIYNFSPSMTVKEALERECREYLERKC